MENFDEQNKLLSATIFLYVYAFILSLIKQLLLLLKIRLQKYVFFS